MTTAIYRYSHDGNLRYSRSNPNTDTRRIEVAPNWTRGLMPNEPTQHEIQSARAHVERLHQLHNRGICYNCGAVNPAIR